MCLNQIHVPYSRPGLVPPEPTGLAFLHLVSYCFYLPLGIMGPLVTSKKFKESTEREERALGSKLLVEAMFGFARYGLWLCVTDISTYITFQQAFTYHVSTVCQSYPCIKTLQLSLT